MPFNPLTRFFFIRYWSFMGALKRAVQDEGTRRTDVDTAVGFGLPFGIAGKHCHFCHFELY